MYIKVIKIYLRIGSEEMKLIVGLGNPGDEYKNTRHNVGFMVLDIFSSSGEWQKKFDGLYKIETISGQKVMLLKPTTYMNLSGNSVRKAMQYYDILVEDILVIQDDIDIEFGNYKLKKNSSFGGHNGIKSIISSIGTDSFARLKVGISHAKSANTVPYVLGKFSKQELLFFLENTQTFQNIITSFIEEGIDRTMNKYN